MCVISTLLSHSQAGQVRGAWPQAAQNSASYKFCAAIDREIYTFPEKKCPLTPNDV